MREYHKINTVYKRDERGRLLEGEWSTPEFEYLQGLRWAFTEKVDGTNIRVMVPDYREDGKQFGVTFGGKTDNAQIPATLVKRLEELFHADEARNVLAEVFPDGGACLYGEGYGAKIQKGGGNYNPDGVDFVLFDVLVGEWWLKRADVEDVARRLGVRTVPVIGHGSLLDAVNMARAGFQSTWGPFAAEGIVMRPAVELKDRAGRRIVAKIKHRDFVDRPPRTSAEE